eukprot:CAMPEP_0173410974 /NCGR_PEP_ID=MMETSP1356-20130122/75845_1 /TAXON_ID=77927 ORGANISM="Hemiselmis virescens, Strain PCC157" /NCGR_SAMPLE_ID=MMETSP1356 /ASSEMBLY_ACC=CAM_ASM_000847 /LENGTH=95 /DNA_ID=CAMNT_0014372667 /DNA_START=13 /DNA_END=296 /DNA_ORIENTATION=-
MAGCIGCSPALPKNAASFVHAAESLRTLGRTQLIDKVEQLRAEFGDEDILIGEACLALGDAYERAGMMREAEQSFLEALWVFRHELGNEAERVAS